MNLDDLEILNLHASGGMAEVFRARIVDAEGRERLLAVKKILPQFTRDKDVLRMFVEEARVAACLDHPNVVAVYDLCLEDTTAPSATGQVGRGGAYYIVMEFADGKDLSDVIWQAVQNRQRLPLGMTVQAARDVARALHHAWNAVDENGVQLKLIHRDVSPHNVLVTWDGRIKLTDFGIAKVQASATKTQMGVIKGKFGYMSPEQARARPLDQRSDLYNVGILMFEAFTGERLFGGATDVETLEQMRAAKIPRLDPALMVPAPLEAFMRRALEKDPNLRPPDALAFEAELLAAADKSRVVPRPNETAHVMAQLFPELARAAAAPAVQHSARLNLRSQLWGPEFAAAAKAHAAARPAVAVLPGGRAGAAAPPASSSVLAAPPPPSPGPLRGPPPAPASAKAAPSLAAAAVPASPRPLPASAAPPRPAVASLPGPVPSSQPSSSSAAGRGVVGVAAAAGAADPEATLPLTGMSAVRAGGAARALDPATANAAQPVPRAVVSAATRVELSPVGPGRAPPPGLGAPLPPTLPAEQPQPSSAALAALSPTLLPPPAVAAPFAPPPFAPPPFAPPPFAPPPFAPPPFAPPPAWGAPRAATQAPAEAPAPWSGVAPLPPPPAGAVAPPAWRPPTSVPVPEPSLAPSSSLWGAPLRGGAPGTFAGGLPGPPSLVGADAGPMRPSPFPVTPLPPPPPPLAAASSSAPPPPPSGLAVRAPLGAAPPPPVAPPPPAFAPSPSPGAPPPPPVAALSPSLSSSSSVAPAPGVPVNAESGFVGDALQATSSASSEAFAEPAPLRRSPRGGTGARFVERWLPRGVRIAAVVVAVVGVVGGLAGGVLAQDAWAQRQRAAMRALVVRTVPDGATVTLDGRRLDGVTPLAVDVELGDGPHTVTLALGAGAPVERKIALVPGERFVLVRATLQAAGRVVVETTPSGARVLLDGHDVGRAPVTLDDVGVDKPHVVEARAPGFLSATAIIPVDRAAEHTATLTLAAMGTPGRLVVLADAPGDVSIDGVPWGPTARGPDDARECAAGRREVVVSLPSLGLRTAMTVDVPAGGLVRVLAGRP